MASAAQSKAAKAIKAVSDPKVKDAMYAIITMIGNVQHESVKAMSESMDGVSKDNVTHLSVSIYNEVERYKKYLETNNIIHDERMTLAMSEVETKFFNHATLIRPLHARSEKLVELVESIDADLRLIKKGLTIQSGSRSGTGEPLSDKPSPRSATNPTGLEPSLDNRIGAMQSCYKRMESRNRGRSPSPSGHGLFHQTGAMTEVAMAAAQVIAILKRRPVSADSHTASGISDLWN